MSQNTDVVRIRVYYDFASTLCYVAHRILSDKETEIVDLGVELEWCPLDLTGIVPWNRGDSFTQEVRATVHNTAQSLGVDVEMPDPWLDSRPASNVALSTPSPETEAHWRRETFDSIFEQKQVELTAMLIDLARELTGNDPPLPADGRFPLVEQSTQDAIGLGVNGVPTFLLDDLLFGGVHDGDSMVSVLGQLAEKYRQEGGSSVN